ncbi:MAG: hypothetical protein V5A72_02190 [Candidatus Nanohaloarchaea archaeon]
MILTDFSHILTFSMLFIAAIFDVRSELGDVPDEFATTAIIGGILLHAGQSYLLGSLSPLIYSISLGLIFSLYGWAAYWKGMWGGADAMALSALGFGAPYMTLSLTGAVQHGFSLFINLVLVASAYTIVFSLIRAYKTEDFLVKLRERLYQDKLRISLEIGIGLIVFGLMKPFRAFFLYISIVLAIFLFRFLKIVERYGMMEEIKVDNLEGGEVIRESSDDRIKGVTEEEIEEIDGKVKVMHGLRFIPVFPVTLVLTDAGVTFFNYLIAA